MIASLTPLYFDGQAARDPPTHQILKIWNVKSFKDRLKRARRARGLTQDQLGEVIGRTKSAISQWEKGDTFPDLPLMPKLCDALKVSADYLILGDGEEIPGMDVIALAFRIARMSPEARSSLVQLFGPAAPADRVREALPPAPKAGS